MKFFKNIKLFYCNIWRIILVFSIFFNFCSGDTIPDHTKYRLNLILERQFKNSKISIPNNKFKEILEIISNSISLSTNNSNSSILEFCNKKLFEILFSTDISNEFTQDLCYNVLKEHIQFVINRQHFAENIYEIISGSCNTYNYEECSIKIETNMDNKQIITPELAYLISDLIPLNPNHKDCVIAFMRIMSLPMNLKKEDAEEICNSVLELRKVRSYYRYDNSYNYEDQNDSIHLSIPNNKLKPFKRAPPFLEIENNHGIGGLKFSSERVSSAKDSQQGFNILFSLPFINNPVKSIQNSEKNLLYTHSNSIHKNSNSEIPKLNGREEIIFNDDIFSDLILPCKTLNYEAKILASMLYYYSVYYKIPISVEDACIVCMRTIFIPSISVPKHHIIENKKGIISNEIFNPFIPSCINAFITISTFLPTSQLAMSYLPSLKTSEAASKALGKLCSKVMNKYIQIFGMIGIGNNNISCTPSQILFINSLQMNIWTNFNALFASNELAQVACRINFDSHASQVTGECVNLIKKITYGVSEDNIKIICQSAVRFLQPQPLVTTPILYTIGTIFQTATETIKGKKSVHVVNFIKLSKKILNFIKPDTNREEYIKSCTALMGSNVKYKLSKEDINLICRNTSNIVLNVISNYYIPQDLQRFHKKQFTSRILFIRKTIINYSKMIKKELQIK